MTPPAMFSPEQLKADGANRVAKTSLQSAGLAAPLVLIVVSALKARHILHGELSTELTLAYQSTLTIFFAALTNLSRLRGKQ